MVLDPTQSDADSLTANHEHVHQPELLTGGFTERIVVPSQKTESILLSVES